MFSLTGPFNNQCTIDDLYTLDDDGEIQHYSSAGTIPVPQALPAVEEVDEPDDIAVADSMVRPGCPPVPKKPRKLRQMRSTPVLPSVSEMLEGYHAVTKKQSLDLPRRVPPAPPQIRKTSEDTLHPLRSPPARYRRMKEPPPKETSVLNGKSTLAIAESPKASIPQLRYSQSLNTLEGVSMSHIPHPSREPPLLPASSHQPQNTILPESIVPVTMVEQSAIIVNVQEPKVLPKRPRTRSSWRAKIRSIASRWLIETDYELEADCPSVRDQCVDEQIASALGSEPTMQAPLCPNGFPEYRQQQRLPSRPVTTFMATRVIEYYAPGGRQQCNVRVSEGRLYS